MKRAKDYAVALTLIIGLCSTAFAQGGSIAGNGSDNPDPKEGSAWFLGADKTIHYCLEVASDFGVDAGTLQTAVQVGFDAWKKYLGDKQIDLGYLVPELALATRVEAMPSCTGQEDVKFYFGVSNEETEIFKQRYENPTAFVARTSYDSTTGWGKGFAWFAPKASVNPDKKFPNWTDPMQLNAMILHEVGHIFGCGHSEGTIMMANISDAVQDLEHLYGPINMGIDFTQQLVICYRCALNEQGLFAPGTVVDSSDQNVIFQYFMGRAPVGDIHTQVEATDLLGSPVSLTIQDQISSQIFEIQLSPTSQSKYFEDGVAFKVSRSGVEGGDFAHPEVGISYEQEGFSMYGQTLIGKKRVSLILQVNGEGNLPAVVGPILIKYMDDNGEFIPLFTSKI
jgi:hypothetical protein